MNTIYAYTDDDREYFGRYKIGQTGRDAETRVAEQDTTSQALPLRIVKTWEVPNHITDEVIHAELERMGILRSRIDKDREWFNLSDVKFVDRAINSLLHGIARPNSFDMRSEQQECYDKFVAHFKSGASNRALMAAKMRYGKTFTAYEIIRAMGLKRVLVITYKPAVDANWREDMESHIHFENWKYYSAKDFSASNPIILDGSADVEILFCSFQDFNDFNKAKWSIAKNYKFDMIVIDEMHYGTKTERAQTSLAQLQTDYTLYISGTPLKALMSGEFLDEEIFTFTYADEQALRRAEEAAGWVTEIYRWLPVMKFHTFEISEEAKKLCSAYSTQEGFTMTKMLASEDGKTFVDASAVKLFVDQIFGIGVRKEHSPIRTHAVDHMLFVLPPNVKSATAFSIYLNSRVGNEYKIINVSGDNVTSLDKVKDTISRNDKTITVTCGRFNTGVTVPEWDMVIMLDDGRSPETYFQTIFRCQSPDKKRRKEECYVIDFNPQRCLEMVYNYADITAKKGESTQAAVRKFLDFAPIMDHSGNKPVIVDVNTVLNAMVESGDYASRFGSSIMFNWSELDKVADVFDNIDAEKNSKISKQVSDNGLEPGKNFEPSGQKKNSANTPDEKVQAEKLLRERVITVMRRIPTFLFLESDIESIHDIIATSNSQLFSDITEISVDEFELLCNTGFINTDRLNRSIVAYQQIEKM
jgi:Type III restriction enzyme, res subunit